MWWSRIFLLLGSCFLIDMALSIFSIMLIKIRVYRALLLTIPGMLLITLMYAIILVDGICIF